MNSPATGVYQNKAHSNHSQTHMESPLRKSSFPVDADGKAAFDEARETQRAAPSRSDSAMESETEDDEIHVDAPAHRISKYTGNGYDPPTEDLGPLGGNTDAEGGWIQETGYGVPILASDEVAKEPGSEYLQPAVSPAQERRGSAHYAGYDSDAPPSYQSGYRNLSRPTSASNSRPSSRPGSIHGSLPGLSRFVSHDEREEMHTPLEDVDEYEPLFPEDECKGSGLSTTAEKKKRHENLKRRFPSQDIWEDTPNSLQLQATVDTPEPIEEHEPSAQFETPATEAKRQGRADEGEKAVRDQPLAKPNWKPHLREEMNKPELKRRFPSQDIWEDSPDSAHLETTVEEPQIEEGRGYEARSPSNEVANTSEETKSSEYLDTSIGRERAGADGLVTEGIKSHETSVPQEPPPSASSGKSIDSGSQGIPSVPARPARRPQHQTPPPTLTSNLSKTSTESSPVDSKQVSPSETRKAPNIPDRPKPQIPARPQRSVPRDAAEMTPLSKQTSASSTGSGGGRGGEAQNVTAPPPPKPKPMIPSRPIGGKIASLKAGFLSDLDKRLQLGPQAPKTSEKSSVAESERKVEEEEKAPLVDARKGRAKGPARRKPAVAAAPPSAIVATEKEDVVKQPQSNWAIQEAWTVWHTEDDGTINAVHAADKPQPPIQKENEPEVGARSPTQPFPSSTSISARDTPTSSRDDNPAAPTFEDLPPAASIETVDATPDSLKVGISAPPAAALTPSAEVVTNDEVKQAGGENEAIISASSIDKEAAQITPVDLSAARKAEGEGEGACLSKPRWRHDV